MTHPGDIIRRLRRVRRQRHEALLACADEVKELTCADEPEEASDDPVDS